MTRLTDSLQALEWELAKYPGVTAGCDLAIRRLVLRQAFESYGRECYEAGRQDGIRDVSDTRSEARRLAEAAEKAVREQPEAGHVD